MSRKPSLPLPREETARPGESFLDRFNRRKTEARLAEATVLNPVDPAQEQAGELTVPSDPEVEAEPELTDADMPPLASLDTDSDYTRFLSPKVSESLRRAALRKLFHGATFNVIDELDDYAEDFTTFEALGDIITSDMRHQIEVEARKKVEALKQALSEEDEARDTQVDTLQSDQQAAETLEPQDPPQLEHATSAACEPAHQQSLEKQD